MKANGSKVWDTISDSHCSYNILVVSFSSQVDTMDGIQS